MWHNYIKGIQNLEKHVIEFFYSIRNQVENMIIMCYMYKNGTEIKWVWLCEVLEHIYKLE